MASYLTRDPMDAQRFIRSLRARGYQRAPSSSRGGQIPRNHFRLSRLEGRIRVAYYEPSEARTRRRIPEPVDSARSKHFRTCTEPGCDGSHFARGLCVKHYRRWEYHSKPEVRERHLLALVRDRERAKARVSA